MKLRSAAIILAAGLSSRMGAFKPLLDVGGMSAIERCITQAKKHCDKVFAVTGHRHEELCVSALGAKEVYNPHYKEGMFTSIRAGVAAAKENGFDGALLWPCDCPLIDADIARRLLAYAEEEPHCFHVACCAGKKGHPLYIPAHLFDQILAHDGTDGMRPVVRKNDELMRRHDFDTDAVLLDMDTPEGYELVKKSLSCPEFEPELFKGRTIWLVRHGETEQHSAPLFIGRTDVPLSDKGIMQAKEAAKALKQELCGALTVYSSPLARAITSAHIIAEELGGSVKAVPGFAELDLGRWDGEFIDSIKEVYPEEYAQRGSELAIWRTPGGENYYDLRRRVWQELRQILLDDPSPNILIVSHLGVIRAAASLVTGCHMETALSRFKPEKGSWIKL